MRLDDGECLVGEEAGQQLVDGGLAELRAKRELLARDSLPSEEVSNQAGDLLPIGHG
jgi:hypothetical protein